MKTFNDLTQTEQQIVIDNFLNFANTRNGKPVDIFYKYTREYAFKMFQFNNYEITDDLKLINN